MSDKSVPDKLRIKANTDVWISHPGRAALLGPLPSGASMVSSLESAEVALVIVESAAEARAAMLANATALAEVGSFWVLYPKGGRADINRDSLWPILAEHGFRPITQVSVDEVWSALRFRLLRAGEDGFKA